MADPRVRTLKIKTGVVKRLAKEKLTYEREYETEKARVEKFKTQEGKDEYDIRKQEEVLQECLMMVPDCQRRLGKAYDELKGILETEKDLQGSEEFKAAEAVLIEAEKQLSKPTEVTN